MKKVAILILAHKPIDYFLNLAIRNKNILFFVHFDKKYDYNLVSSSSNLIILKESDRVDVKWGGFSQVRAMLNLFSFALTYSDSEFFHLVSGEDVLLSKDELALESLMWGNSDIFMDIQNSLKHRFRVRFFA
ncbi:beta-1,6-N-acetylglucosaminyltransferase, partial [Acinetobacter baumannii]|uniref:beta-1,6-N-acetylglucosaminyltransferase n=1 Tax=Acinetobacter baumannii TaxID=470 RepID=UPI00312C870A